MPTEEKGKIMEEEKILNRDVILAADDLMTEEVFIPQWNGKVKIRGITASERDELEASIFTDEGKPIKKNFRAKIVALALCDERGNRIFSDADIEALGKKNGAAINLVFGIAQRLSGIGQEAINIKKK